MAQYSDQQRAEALAALDANGGNVARTAKALGIPRPTLILWRDGRVSEGVSELRHLKKQELAERLEAIAHTILDSSEDKLAAASFKDALTGLGIAVDKMQLLRGEPTAINRDDSLTDEQRVEELAALADAARARASGSAPQEPAPVN